MIFNKINYKNGSSFLEVTLVVAIIVIIISISVVSFTSSNKRQALDKSQILLVSILNEARSLSVSGKNASKYGVHIEQGSIALFTGDVYVEGGPDNHQYELNKFVEISPDNISLSGGGDDIVFEKGTGQTNNTGFIRISLKGDQSASTTVNISTLGIFNTK